MFKAIINWLKTLDEFWNLGFTETQIDILADNHFILGS